MDENTVVIPQAEQNPQGDAAVGTVQNAATDNPETGVTTEAAAPQEKSASERFAYALKQRVSEERTKLEKEQAQKYANDLRLAQEVRKAFSGKDDTSIVTDLLEAQVKVFASENGISEALARKFIELERKAKPDSLTSESKADTSPAASMASDAWLARLARQRDTIKATHGVDVLDGLSESEERQIMQGELDLNEVFSMRSKAQTPPPVNRGVASQAAPINYNNMTDDEYRALRARLNREGQIDIRSE